MTPPMQVVHVDDAASALALAVDDDLDGVFNVAADGWLDYDEAAAIAPHRRPPAVPEEMAATALGAMWGSGLGEAPPEVLPYVMHPWVVGERSFEGARLAAQAHERGGDPPVGRPRPRVARRSHGSPQSARCSRAPVSHRGGSRRRRRR